MPNSNGKATPVTETQVPYTNDQMPNTIDKKGFIVSKATDLDFSCGGFLSTKIDNRNTDFVGKRVNTAHFNKMRFINNYILSSTEMATYKNAIWMVASFSDRLNLPVFVKERAAEIFKKCYYSRSNIHNSKNIVCASIYYSAKEAKINRTLQDIAEAAIENKDYTSAIFIAYQKLIKILKLEVPKNFPTVSEISILGSRIGLPEHIVRQACNIFMDIRSKNRIYFAGKSPRITAAVLLYIAHRDRYVDAEALAEATGVSKYILERRVDEHINKEIFKPYRSEGILEEEFIQQQTQGQMQSFVNAVSTLPT